MLLAVDIGNTKISFGVYKNGVLKATAGFLHGRSTDTKTIELEVLSVTSGSSIKKCIISSVVNELTNSVKNAIENALKVSPMILTAELNIGIKIKSKTPRAMGADRIANAVAGSKICNKRPIIVVDAGTAITFDIVDKDSFFIGGIIMPGLQMQLDALNIRTSKLPEIKLFEMEDLDKVINDGTVKSIFSGVINGQAQAIQGLIEKCEQELGEKAFLIGTGGDAIRLNRYMDKRKFDVINTHLTLDGISMIYELNA